MAMPSLKFTLRFIRLIASLALLVSVGSQASTPEKSVSQDAERALEVTLAAIQRLADTDFEQWGYTRTVASDGEILIDRHDPSLPGEEHWQLVSIDGQQPTDKDWKEYRRKRANHAEDPDKDNRYDTGDLAAMIQAESLVSVAYQGPGQRWQFTLKSPDGEHERRFRGLRGELLIHSEDQQAPFIEWVRIWTDEAISPAFGIRLQKLDFDVRFVDLGAHVLPVKMDVFLEGRIFWLKDISTEYNVAFSQMQAP